MARLLGNSAETPGTILDVDPAPATNGFRWEAVFGRGVRHGSEQLLGHGRGSRFRLRL